VFGGIIALNGVSFDMRHGQISPDRAERRGKTTLFNCLRGSISRRPAIS